MLIVNISNQSYSILSIIYLYKAMNQQNHFIIQKIIGKRYNNTKKRAEYRIKWLGYPVSESTWEPISNLSLSLQLVRQFEEEEKGRARLLKTPSLRGTRGKRIAKANRTSNQKGAILVKEEDSFSDSSQRIEDFVAPEEVASNHAPEEDNPQISQMPFDPIVGRTQELQAPDHEDGSNPLSFSTFSDLNEKMEILCLSKHNGSLYFKVRWGEDVKWISHALMLNKYLKELIEFYEQFITLD